MLKFHRVTVAYLILRDRERTAVLDAHGWRALVRHESYLSEDVFDCDPWDVYERFFAGEDPADREYLLMNGGDDDDDDEGDGETDCFPYDSVRVSIVVS